VPPAATPLDVRAWWASRRAGDAALPAFAAALAEMVGAHQAWTASSGRTVLRLVLATLCRHPARGTRHEVVLPGYTCPSVAKVVLDAGLKPRWVDVLPTTLDYLPEALAQAVSSATLAVVAVHPFGLPADVQAAKAVAHGAGAWLIEDAAQSLGARIDQTFVGTIGDVGLYSFGPGKPLALGGGGVAVTRDRALAAALTETWAALPQATTTTARWAWARMGLFSLAFQPPLWWLATRLGAQRAGENEASWGYTLRGLTAAQAALGLAMLPQLDAINRRRRAQAAALTQAVQGALQAMPGPEWVQPAVTGAVPIYLRLPLLAPTEAQADGWVRALNRAGIGAGRVYRHTLAEFFPTVDAPPLPGSDRVARTLLTLPTNHHLPPDAVARVVEVMGRTLA
jgi:dTDP-4-amino-4,6-dideoxygalactose transaminase